MPVEKLKLDPVPPSPVSAEGHRQRLRARLLTAGPESVADHEMLELVLFLALPRRDTKPVARALLARFGSFANAIAAPLNDLRRVQGIGEGGAAALKTVHAAALRLLRAEVKGQPLLSNWRALMDYLTAILSREQVEQFRVLFLDSRNRLVADEVKSRGTVNHTAVSPREVAKRALELHATAVILVHNHPNGDPTPSQDDLQMTMEIRRALSTVDVVLHDHVIMGSGSWLSFRQEGILDA